MWQDLIQTTYFKNSVIDYLMTVGTILGGVFSVWMVRFFVIRRIKNWAAKTTTPIDDFLITAIERNLVPLLYFGVIYLSLSSLTLNPAVGKGLKTAGAVLLTLLGIRFVTQVLRFFILDIWVKRKADGEKLEVQFRGLMPALNTIVWTVGIIFLLDNLGFEISTVVAGLGIGGVAVALAANAVLADVFSYFAIMIDRPFVIGDFIIVGDFLGAVEYIGIKTTRIRSLGGELLIFSNKDLTDSRIRNYKKMQKRRVLFKLGVTYDTPLAKLKDIPSTIKAIVEKTPHTTFDRAHFSSYGDFNLEIEIVYYVLSSDYNKYMDIQQAINFAIKEEFEKRKIEFAFPTQTLYVNKA